MQMRRIVFCFFCILHALHSRAQSLPELQAPLGHSENISQATYSHNGNFIATGSRDQSVIIWDAYNGKAIRQLFGHLGAVTSCVFSNDDKLLVTGGNDNQVCLWEIKTGKRISSFDLGSGVTSLAISDQNNFIVAGSFNGAVVVWNATDLTVTTEIRETDPVMALSFNKSENRILVQTTDSLKLYHLVTGKLESAVELYNLDAQPGKRSAFLTDDNKIIVLEDQMPSGQVSASKTWRVSINYDSSVLATNISTGKQFQLPVLHPGFVMINPVSDCFFIRELNGGLSVYQLPLGRKIAELTNHSKTISTVIVDKLHHQLILKYSDGNLTAWGLRNGALKSKLTNAPVYDLNDALLSQHNNYIILSMKDSLMVWDAATLTPVLSVNRKYGEYSTDQIGRFDISPDEKFLAVSYFSGLVDITELTSGKVITVSRGGDDLILQMKFTADSKYLVTVNEKKKFYAFDLHEKKTTLSIPDVNVDFLEAPDGNRVLLTKTRGNDVELLVVSCESKKVHKNISLGKKTFPRFALLTHDSKKLLVAEDFTVTAWNIIDSRKLFQLPRLPFSITSISMDSNGREFQLATADGLLGYYDMTTGKLLRYREFGPGTKPITSFSNNSKIVVASVSSVYFIDNSDSKKSFEFIPIDDDDNVIRLADNHFLASPHATRWLQWLKDSIVYDFDQWDMEYNRPDLVLKTLGNTDSAMIEAYYKAYTKRITRNGQFTKKSITGNELPFLEILNEKLLATNTKSRFLNIQLHSTAARLPLSKIHISINGVPLYGTNGFGLKQTSDTMIEFSILLNEGSNKLKFWCTDTDNNASLKKTWRVNYQPDEKFISKLWYIGIGVNNYKDSTYDLNYATKDVQDLASAFSGKDTIIKYFFLDENATRSKILELKKKLMDESTVDDAVIISFSGHGLLDKKMDFYFATYDMNFQSPSENGLSFTEIENLVDSIPARQKLVFIDACHSGVLDEAGIFEANEKTAAGSKGGELTNISPGRNAFLLMQDLFNNAGSTTGITVIAAAAGNERAFEGNSWKNGVFTHCILLGINNMMADLNRDNAVTVAELEQFVGREVLKLTDHQQKPASRQINYDNDWIIKSRLN
jgi:WD40 repeat protein